LDPNAEPEPGLSRRTRRGIALISASLAVIVVVGLLYLHPKIGVPAPQPVAKPTPTPPALAGSYSARYEFVTPSIGWAMVLDVPQSTLFWVFKTTDGAKNWMIQATFRREVGSRLNPQIRFFDRSHGIVIAGTDSIWRTSDGGLRWTKVTSPVNGLVSVTFSDPMHGWARGAAGRLAADVTTQFVSTADGGDTWTPLPPPPPITDVVFRSPVEGWAGGADPNRPTVYSSNDGGATWSAHLLAGGVEPVEGRLWMTTPRVFLIPARGVIAHVLDTPYASFDGGVTWRILVPPPAVSYYEVAFEDATHWWAMQRDGAIYKTADSGQSWNRVSLHHLDGLSYVVGIIDSKHAWAQFFIRSLQDGFATGLALTADGGVHWTYANVPTPPYTLT
jgi:photosystem II stability/assembly factor-like uncharacterized protein